MFTLCIVVNSGLVSFKVGVQCRMDEAFYLMTTLCFSTIR